MSDIADQLAHSADLPPAEIGAYLQALHAVGLVSSEELGPETTSEAIVWTILAVLSGPDPRRAAERARDVAFFRNFRASLISYSGSDAAGSYRDCAGDRHSDRRGELVPLSRHRGELGRRPGAAGNKPRRPAPAAAATAPRRL